MDVSQNRAYCVGTPKSGTHSLCAIVSPVLRSAHEPDSETLISSVLNGIAISVDQQAAIIRSHDTRLDLEFESSQLLVYFMDGILREFPAARFVLSFRDPLDWMDSFINHQMTRSASPLWMAFRDHRFSRAHYRHSSHARVLEQLGLYTIEGYLSYWAWHNMTILDKVPAPSLHIVNTKEISERVSDLLQFLVPECATAKPKETHCYSALERLDILSQVDSSFLTDTASRICEPVMRRVHDLTGSMAGTNVVQMRASASAPF